MAEITGKAETLKKHSGFFKARFGRVGLEGQARVRAAASPPPAA